MRLRQQSVPLHETRTSRHLRELKFVVSVRSRLNIGDRCFAVFRNRFVLSFFEWDAFAPKADERAARHRFERFPPGHLIAGLMKLPVMTATERDGELITDFEADGSGLCKAQMMRVGRLPPANQTGL